MTQGALVVINPPVRWSWKRLWAAAPRVQEVGQPDAEPLSVFLQAGVVPRSSREDNHNQLGEDLSKYQVVQPGDLVFNKLRTWQGGLGVSAYHGIVSPAYFVCRPIHDWHARYLHYLLLSSPYLSELKRLSKFMPPSQFDIPWDMLRTLPLLHPPVDGQRRIANFLDAETSRIDALSETYEATKTTIDERVQRLIDLHVDSAGDPVPLKYFVRFREGPGIMALDFRDEGTPLIRISGLRDGIVTLNGANFLDEDAVAARWSQFRLRLSDYIISGSATMGAVSVVKDPAVVGAIPYTGLIILRPAKPDVVMEYVAAVLSSSMFLRQIDLLKAGATMQHFGPTHLAQVSIPLPVRELQESIASTVHDIREQASKTIAAIDRQIALLAERRLALITAAVTGAITV